MTNSDISRLYQFMMEDFAVLRKEMNSGFAHIHETFDRKFDSIYIQLDAVRDKLDTIEVEQAAQNSQLNRHDDTLQLLLAKTT